MLCSYVIVTEIGSFLIGKFESFFYFPCQCRISIHLNFGAKADDFFYFSANGFVIQVHVPKNIYSNALAEFHKPKKDVLSPKVIVIESLRFFFCKLDDLLGSISKFIEHRFALVLFYT